MSNIKGTYPSYPGYSVEAEGEMIDGKYFYLIICNGEPLERSDYPMAFGTAYTKAEDRIRLLEMQRKIAELEKQ